MNRLRIAVLTLVVISQVNLPQSSAEDWTGFRGPRGNGISTDTKIPTEWSESKNLKWKLKLPGAGFSSPIIIKDKVFVTAWDGERSDVKRHLVCVDRSTGKVAWSKTVKGISDGGDPGFAYHGQASHTPVTDGERIYVMFGSNGIFAYDLAGKQIWHQDLGKERRARFGTASSPILYKEMVIVTAGNESETMRAFDRKTGKEIWKSEAQSLSGSYSTPVIAKNPEGEDEILISVPYELWAMNPKNGKLKWYAETKVDTAACPAVLVDNGIVYVIGGRSGGRTAVKIGGKDDVTEKNVVWSERGGSYVPSPVLHKGKLYWINDRGIGTCVDAKTGKELGRKRIGGDFYSSITIINDKLYAVSRFDGAYVFEPSPDFKQIAHNKPLDETDHSGSLAVSDGQLFIRSDSHLYCISQ